MALIHQPQTGDQRPLARRVEYADSFLKRALGLIGTKTVPQEYALVFPFSGAGPRTIHTVGVRTAIDVIWTVEEEVTAVETLPPWRGLSRNRADTVIECHAGVATDVVPGDRVTVEA